MIRVKHDVFKWMVTVSCFDELKKLRKNNRDFALCKLPKYPKKPSKTKTCDRESWRRSIELCKHARTKEMPPQGVDPNVYLWKKTVLCLKGVDERFKSLCGKAPRPCKPNNRCQKWFNEYWALVSKCSQYKDATWGLNWMKYGNCL